MNIKRKLFGAALGLILLPAMAFGASVNVNLKDAQGSPFTDLSGITVRVLDGTGGLVQEVIAPPTDQVSFSNLSAAESYTIVTKYQKAITVEQNNTVNVTTASTKTLRFADDTEILNKDFFINDPVASNVLLRVSRIPADWTGVKVKLTPVESSRLQIDATNLLFTLTPFNGSAELVVPSMPYARYSWEVSNQDDTQVTVGSTFKSVRNNATLSFNLEAAKPQIVNMTFKLVNPDRTAGIFNGQNISVNVKDSTGTVVWSGNVVANGADATLATTTLANGTYTVEATMSEAGKEVSRTSTRTILLSGTPRNMTINFTALDTRNISFLVRDSRSSQPLDGTIKVYASDGTTLIDTINVVGGSASRSFIYGYPYKLEASATGHASRSINLYPRENIVREINLFAQ